jgi:surface polysaccharide O-acyltransferase-like enzyme
MIILVVLIHINVTYSGIGGWYYTEQDVNNLDTFSKVLSGLFGMFTQAYFMGLLFFIAGYFIPASYDRKGAGKFIIDRFVRLGIPVLIYIFIINPLILHFLLGVYKDGTNEPFPGFYSNYISLGNFIGGTGPLWFALALFIFSVLYAAIRYIGVKPISNKNSAFSGRIVTAIIITVSIITFIVRLYFPFGTDIYNMQLCFFTQYIVLFAAGIISYRKNLFINIPYKFGIRWMKYGISFGMLFWIIIILLGGALNGDENLYFGGLYWQSAAYSLWESIICAAMTLGLLVLFREKFNKQNKISKFLTDNAFGVYAFHAPILIFISITLKNIELYPIIKIIFIAVITLPVCFIFSLIIRKIPLIKRLFS